MIKKVTIDKNDHGPGITRLFPALLGVVVISLLAAACSWMIRDIVDGFQYFVTLQILTHSVSSHRLLTSS